jgi:hypothetical protein
MNHKPDIDSETLDDTHRIKSILPDQKIKFNSIQKLDNDPDTQSDRLHKAKSVDMERKKTKKSNKNKPKIEKMSKIKIYFVYVQSIVLLILFLNCLYLNYKVSRLSIRN